MTTLQIKNKLIRSIKSVENPELLEDLYRLLHIEVENIEKLNIPLHIRKSIVKGQKDIRAGKYLSNKQADVEIDKWLKK